MRLVYCVGNHETYPVRPSWLSPMVLAFPLRPIGRGARRRTRVKSPVPRWSKASRCPRSRCASANVDNGQLAATTTTNERGEFRFTDLPVGNYVVETIARGRQHAARHQPADRAGGRRDGGDGRHGLDERGRGGRGWSHGCWRGGRRGAAALARRALVRGCRSGAGAQPERAPARAAGGAAGGAFFATHRRRS